MTAYRVTFSVIVDADDEEYALEMADQQVRAGQAAITVGEYDEEAGSYVAMRWTLGEHTTTPWRVGRKVGRTIYTDPGHDLDGDLIGMMDTPDLARVAVEAHNALLSEQRGQ